jgi:hypothetical protein
MVPKFFKEYKKMDLTIAPASYSGRRWTEKELRLKASGFQGSETGSWELEERGIAKVEGRSLEERREV